jgi:type II secretory pathway pseudopilin PulG
MRREDNYLLAEAGNKPKRCITISRFCLKLIKNQLSGFTLLEQIIVLALTTILVLIGFTAILNFQQLMAKVRANAQKDRNVYLLQLALENDFRDAVTIGWEDGLNLEKDSGTVRYEFENTYLIRQATEKTDTFHFVTSDVSVSKVKDNEALVETIAFKVIDPIQSYKMTFFKEYPDYKIREEKEDGN